LAHKVARRPNVSASNVDAPGGLRLKLPSAEPENHFDRFDLLLLPAFFRAIATACFCGLPAFISVLMLELIVFREEPFLRGIDVSPASVRTLVEIHEPRRGFKIRHDAFV
jgi:hypothetical protein